MNDNATFAYTYTFNVCKNVVNQPPACAGAPPAAAYQWSTAYSPPVCYPLSNSFSGSPPPVTVDLLDPLDSSAGFNLTYLPYADPANPTGCQRALHLLFRCGYEPFRPATGSVDTRALVVEVDSCRYEAYSWTLAGCPKQCPIGGNGQLCSNLGICAFDKQMKQPRCFCDVSVCLCARALSIIIIGGAFSASSLTLPPITLPPSPRKHFF